VSQDQVVVLAVLVGTLAVLVTEVVPLGVAGLCVIATLGLSGVLDAASALSAFSSPTVVLVGSLYVLSAALIGTGVVDAFEGLLVRLGGRSEFRVVVVSTLGVAVVSGFLNNTAIVVLMVPILLGAAQRLDLAPSRLLMPVSYAAILGGMMTLIGTSTNVLVADLAWREARIEIGFFDFLPVGAGFAAVGLLYLWVFGRRLLPTRQTVSSTFRGRTFEYVTELRVPEAGPATGMTLAQLRRRVGDAVRILQLVQGEEVISRIDDETHLRPGDVVVVRGSPKSILSMCDEFRLDPLPGAGVADGVARRGTTFVEVVITPVSELVGRTLAAVGLYRRFGVLAIAVQRRGAHLRHGITNIPLRVGDTILIQGTPEEIERLRGNPGLLLLVGVQERVVLRRRAPVAVAILGSFVAVAATGRVPLPLLAIAGASAALVTGCISLRRAIRETDWNVLGLLAGVITLGLALQRSGLADEIGRFAMHVSSDYGPFAVLSAVYLLTAIMTEFVSNAGAAAIMLPVGLSAGAAMGVDQRPFVFAVAFAASASFSTPIGYQTNTFVLGPGGYRFRDFVRVGLPLQILLWIYASLAVPLAFPF